MHHMLLAADEVAAAETSSLTSLVVSLLPFAVIIGVFYFFLIRPQQKQQKARNEMLSALDKGDKVITAGGMYGEIVELRDDSIILQVGDKVRLKMTRGSVSRVID